MPEDVRCGHILRLLYDEPASEGTSNQSRQATPIFSDCIIVDMNTKMEVSLVRPYMYAEGVDTSCRTWSAGFEQFKVNAFKLLAEDSRWHIVLNSTGEPAKMER
jgi:hypothetical protein